MFQFLLPHQAGNAVRISLQPPQGALFWRVLRRVDGAFTGPTDPGATVVAQTQDRFILDTSGLANGQAYLYCAYSWDGEAWTTSEVASCTPQATYGAGDVDPQSIVIDRLKAGLAVEAAAGRLPKRPNGKSIRVVTAPFALADGIEFPIVSVHLDTDSPNVRAIGDDLGAVTGIGDDESLTGERASGWEARTDLSIVAASQNGDERIMLRRAIRRVLIANLEVFQSLGLDQVEFTARDNETFEEKSDALYFTSWSFSCVSAAFVTFIDENCDGLTTNVTVF